MLIVCTLAAVNAHADLSYNVNTTDDLVDDNTDDGVCHAGNGSCSLRAAIMQANHLVGAGITTITVPAGVFQLTRPISGPDGEDNGDLNLTVPNSASQYIAIVGAGVQKT
ncbi:MAG: hypothetical protein ABI411_13760, partial [Tahibacter sp.]